MAKKETGQVKPGFESVAFEMRLHHSAAPLAQKVGRDSRPFTLAPANVAERERERTEMKKQINSQSHATLVVLSSNYLKQTSYLLPTTRMTSAVEDSHLGDASNNCTVWWMRGARS